MPFHHPHIEHIQYSLRREINEFYWATAIRNFGGGLLGIFVPIFVYLYFDKSITYTFLFYGIQYLGHGLLVSFTARLIKRVGVKKMMAIGNPLLAIYIIFLMLASDYGLSFMIMALAAKIVYLSIYWPAHHIDFAKFSEDKKRGRQIGTANIIIALVKTVAPFLGGYIIVQFGFPILFIIASTIIVLSSLPLFFSPEVYEEFTLSWKQSFRRMFAPKNRRTSLAFAARGIENIMAITVFPIFIYIMISDFETIGTITSLTLIIALLFTYLVGWLNDKRGSERVINIASIAHAFAWLINAFIRTPLQYFFFSSFLKFSQVANQIPFTSLFYGRAKGKGHGLDEYVIFYEVTNSLAGGLVISLMALGFAFGFDNWLAYFSLAALAALSYQFMIKPDKSLFSRFKK